jgi:hypothetical protein
MGRQITIRGVSEDLSRRLRAAAEQRGCSVNTLCLELLGRAVGASHKRERLQRYATATSADADALDQAIAVQRSVDPTDWQ